MNGEATAPLGTLTERLQLMRRSTSHEAEGGEVVSFSPFATVWGRVRALTARAAFAADARGQAITHSVVIRFRPDLRAGDRIVWRGTTLEVAHAADLDGRRAYLSCQCLEQAVTG
ncbi:MAG TPA: phage head closure protein [Hypericibacter adhaerens]|uniref:phage head closure protein n=1 Tax=Hypericibacter adhaerens TaxID=2602016 RepID=UPI002C01F159|nr:phage head closure protein [Hypericibacter adhaerens]HWA42162.1 phage head closure protein [Hypericibacter adhaerens]